MSGFDALQSWLQDNATDLALDADNPAQLTWELEQLRITWSRSFNDRLRFEETWKVLERHPRVAERAVLAGFSAEWTPPPDTVPPTPAGGASESLPYPEGDDVTLLPVAHRPRTRTDLVLGTAMLALVVGVVILGVVAATGGFAGVSPFFTTMTALAGVLVGYYLGRKSHGGH